MASGATVGSAIVKLEFDGSEVKASIQGIGKDVEKAGSESGKSWASAWSVAAGNLISNAVTKISGIISSSFSSAVARVDTLKNANKVFEALGYSAEDVSKSMSTLTSYLDGLPTSMNDAVSGVQSLSASFGGIDKGTEYFIAMNDAGLAFGATTAQIENAITQLGQLSLDGPLDAQTWNSLRNSGFGPVFAAMAKEAGITVGQLKEDFGGEGTKTVEDFLNALVKLDKEGGASMASLSELAKVNTEGLQTQFENIKNSLNKVVASAITGDMDAIDGQLNQLVNRVAAVIPTIVQTFTTATPLLLQAAIDIIPKVIEALGKELPAIAETVMTAVSSILDKLPTIITMLVGFIIQIVQALIPYIPQILMSIVDAVIQLAQMLTTPEMLNAILQAGIALLMALVQAFPQVQIALLQALPQIIDAIITFFTDPGTIAMLIEAAVTLFFALVEAVPQILDALLKAFGGIFASAFAGVISLLDEFISIFSDIFSGFGEWIDQTVEGIGQFIDGIVQGIADFIGGIIDFVSGIFQGAFDFISGIFDSISEVAHNIFQGIGDFIDSVIENIRGVFQGVADFISGVWEGMKEGASKAWEGIKSIFSTVANFFGNIFSNAWEAVKKVFSVGGKIFDGIKDGIVNAFKTVVNAIINGINKVVKIPFDAINGVLEGLRGIDILGIKPFGWLGTISVPQIPTLATGGYADGATNAIIGEAGKEIVLPLEQNTDNWAGLLASTLSEQMAEQGSSNGDKRPIIINAEINNDMDAYDLGRVIMEAERRAA